MWQVLVLDTSFWTCFWFLFGATMSMSLSPWKVISAAYIYSSIEFVITSAVHHVPHPELTWLAYKVAVAIGIVFGPTFQPKGSPWLLLALTPGLTLYFHPEAMFGVAAVYVVSCLLLRYYTWALYCFCVCGICLILPQYIGAAPLIGMAAPTVIGFAYIPLYIEPAPFLPE